MEQPCLLALAVSLVADLSISHISESSFLSSLCFQHPTYELGMQMNLRCSTPLLAQLFPSFHQCSLAHLNSGKAAALVWVMATDAGNKSSAPLHQRFAVCYWCAEANVS